MNEQVTRTRVVRGSTEKPRIIVADQGSIRPNFKLTENEKIARRITKYATTTFGFATRRAYEGGSSTSGGDITLSSQGNFYSPQLSTDFLEKPQNLRERRAWYRTFYNGNEYVGSAIDLHSTLPLSKVKLEKPKCKNEKMADYVYTFFEDMCNEMKLFKTLLEISHDFWLLGNCVSPNSLILNKLQGFVKAKDVNVGDEVLTHNGRFRKVTNKCSRISERINEISIWKDFNKLELTKEHPVEVYRDGKFSFVQVKDLTIDDYVRVIWPSDVFDTERVEYIKEVDYKNIILTDYGYDREVTIKRKRDEKAQICRERFLKWLGNLSEPKIVTREELAKELNTKTMTLNNVIYQLKLELGDIFSRHIGAKGYQMGSQVQWIPFKSTEYKDIYSVKRIEKFEVPSTIDIDEDFCYLLGYWLGDGTLARDNSRKDEFGRGLWQIAFGRECSKEQIEKIRNIIIKKFGTSCIKEWDDDTEYYGGINKLHYIKIKHNPVFIEWWALNFGETSHGDNRKRVPQWVINLPKNKLQALLSGAIDSDGCIGRNEYIIGMTSELVMRSLREVALKCNIVCNFNKQEVRYDNRLLLNYEEPEISRDIYTLKLKGLDCVNTIGNTVIKKLDIEEVGSSNNVPKYIKTEDGKLAFKIRSIEEKDYNDLVYNFEVEEDHTYQVNGFSTHNCFIFAEEHEPYETEDKEEEEGKEEINQLKEYGKERAKELFEKFGIVDKDPNYNGWKRLIILPPDQVRVKKVPLTDDSMIEFMPDPETKKSILGIERVVDANQYDLASRIKVPEKIKAQLQQGGTIPMDTDPNSGSYVFHLARKKSQYETMGVSILERCVNTLLFQDKLRQAQTSIASRHMTPIRVVWGDKLDETQTEQLREQVDLAMTDPDFSIIANYEVNWQEMGSGGRLLELSSEFEHIENSLFAGLMCTREMLTGEGTYTGSKLTLEVMNRMYVLFRELLQDYVDNYLFKPVAKKKGFVEKDEFGRERLIYPKLSFTRLAIKDNDTYFDQVFQLYNKGSISVDIILEMLGIDPNSTKKKIEADLFTVNDSNFNTFIQNVYTSLAQEFVTKYDIADKMSKYLGIPEAPTPPAGAEAGGGLGGLGGPAPRFASKGMSFERQAAIEKLMGVASAHPERMNKIVTYFNSKKATDGVSFDKKTALSKLLEVAANHPDRLDKIVAYFNSTKV